jgi:hypothetical protein
MELEILGEEINPLGPTPLYQPLSDQRRTRHHRHVLEWASWQWHTKAPNANSGRAVLVYCCPQTFIGQALDTEARLKTKALNSLALPRGLEPLFSP